MKPHKIVKRKVKCKRSNLIEAVNVIRDIDITQQVLNEFRERWKGMIFKPIFCSGEPEFIPIEPPSSINVIKYIIEEGK